VVSADSFAARLARVSFLKRHADVVLMASLAVFTRVGFWAVTGRVWEDALITIAHARNALAGLGLTHHPGEPPTHGFTSALSVLIPLAGEAISRDGGLAALRLVSLLCVVVTIVAADALGRRLGVGRWGRLLILGYLAVDANHIFYGMSGMETQVAVAALLVSAWAFTARHPASGLALGVALLARPDFLIWAAILVGVQLWRDRAGLVRLVVGAAVVVGPWVAFTTAYYGSPIPQTVSAKVAALTSFPIDQSPAGWLAWALEKLLSHVSTVVRTFAPFLEDTLAVRAPVPIVALVAISAAMATLAVIGGWARRRDQAWTPVIWFVALDLLYRVAFLPPVYSDWYVPPFTALAILLVAAGVERVASGMPARAMALAVALVAVFAFPLPWVFSLERAIQVEIEDGVRSPAAASLATMVAPGESVASESAGYIGFLSHVTLWDYPGLTSRTVLAAVQRLPPGDRSLAAMIDELKPDWLVLRPMELQELASRFPATARLYREAERFGSPIGEIERFGYAKVTVDGEFIVMRRSP
jgi:hypothetical protein